MDCLNSAHTVPNGATDCSENLEMDTTTFYPHEKVYKEIKSAHSIAGEKSLEEKIASRPNNDDFYYGINARKNAEALKQKMDITEVNKIYEEIKLTDPVASDNELLFRLKQLCDDEDLLWQKVYNDLKLAMPDCDENKIRQMATHKIIELDATANFAKNRQKSHADREAFLNKSEKLAEPVADEKREHHIGSYIRKEGNDKIIQKSRDDTQKPEVFNDISPWQSSSFSAYEVVQ